MSDLTERLAEALEVCGAATEGPWEADTYMTKPRRVIDIESGGFKTEPSKLYGSLSIIPSDGVYGEFDGHDAEFIATARTGYPAALRALLAVMGLHGPFEWSFGYGPVTSCKGCVDQGVPQEKAEWPCPTVRAVTEHLGDTP